MTENKKNLYVLLGTSLVTQATTSLIGGIIGIGPFNDTGSIVDAMNGIAGNITGAYIGIFLQVITAIVIIVLGTALYQAGKHISQTLAIIAFGLYLTEAVIHIVNQIIVVALAEISRLFLISGDASLVNMGTILYAARDFCGGITMMPFGLGAIMFYYLIMKSNVIPKWLGLWGLISVPFILVGWTLEAFNVSLPFVLYAPYVPWEWVAGIYIFIKSLREASR